MERREFLRIAASVAAGVAALAATAQAAPLMPQPLNADAQPPQHPEAQPAVASGDDIDRLQPQPVHWRRRHWGWRRRHWGWRRRHWRRHYW